MTALAGGPVALVMRLIGGLILWLGQRSWQGLGAVPVIGALVLLLMVLAIWQALGQKTWGL